MKLNWQLHHLSTSLISFALMSKSWNQGFNIVNRCSDCLLSTIEMCSQCIKNSFQSEEGFEHGTYRFGQLHISKERKSTYVTNHELLAIFRVDGRFDDKVVCDLFCRFGDESMISSNL